MSEKDKDNSVIVQDENVDENVVIKDAPPIAEITDEEFWNISRDLEGFHAIFYRFWEMGRPMFTNAVPTAGIIFDRLLQNPIFIFNPKFWNMLNDYNKRFVICHEMLHLILNHGIRQKGSKIPQITNIAQDIVINHLLVNHFKFSKRMIQEADKFCWVDTVFVEELAADPKSIPDNKHYEYYLNKLIQKLQDQKGQGQGQGQGTGQGQGAGGGGSGIEGNGTAIPGVYTVDKHDPDIDPKDFEQMLSEINDSLSDEEKEQVKETIQENFQQDANADTDGSEGNSGGGDAPGGGRGTSGTGVWTFLDQKIRKVRKKRKWETIIVEWARKFTRPVIKGVERWGRTHRRLTAISTGNMHLPCEVDIDTFDKEEYRLDVWFFVDVSGSCYHLVPRFFKAALSLPEDKFEVDLFDFNTNVHPVDKEKLQTRQGGGTSFTCIEQAIQQEMKTRQCKYPHAVFIITDGWGDRVKPEHPERWYWFLSDNSRDCIPKESKIHMLKDFE